MKLIKSDSKGIDNNVTKDLFEINAVLLNFATWKKLKNIINYNILQHYCLLYF